MLPLEGIRVVDFSIAMAGPTCSLLLADFGADVVKVERPGRELARNWGSHYHGENGEFSGLFLALNRNKRGVALDLKSPEGLATVEELIAGADVVIENFRPGIADRLGFGYERARELNPRVVYCSISGFGQNGPLRDRPGLDMLLQAYCGHLSITGEEGRPSVRVGHSAIDLLAGTHAAFGIMVALHERDRSGVGQRVDTSLLGSMLALRGLDVALQLMTQRGDTATSPFHQFMGEETYSRLNPGNPLWNSYLCGDGKWIAMALLQSDPHWQNFLDALDRPESLAGDPRFATHLSRCQNCRSCVELLDGIFASKPREEWLRRLLAKGDMPITAMNSMADIGADVQALENGYVTSFEHPAAGPTKVPGFPVTLSETPASIRHEAPEFGQHTEEILMEVLEMDWDDITALREQQVIL